MIRIKVPATTANFGIGFDCLGLAINIYNEYQFEESTCFRLVGFDQKYGLDNNLLLEAYIKVFQYYNEPLRYVKITQLINEIPLARGLGSSASLIVSGVLAANYFLGKHNNENELLKIATEIEGHPDNVSSAMLGGLVATFKNDKDYITSKLKISNKLKFNILISENLLETTRARKALPEKIDYYQAINNISRSLVLYKYLEEGNFKMLKKVLYDELHEKYRYPLIKDGLEIKNKLTKENKIVLISGAGPSLLVISEDNNIDIHEYSLFKCVSVNICEEGALIYE